METVKAVITTLDNLANLKEQIPILCQDLYVSEIAVVNNGSNDGTKEWLDAQEDLTIAHKENLGAGPGRNTGLNIVGKCDYLLMMDGGIRPLRGGTEKMLDYLRATPDCDVIGIEILDFEAEKSKAWRRWVDPINPENTYINSRLSHTAYCLARYSAFDSLRFCEEGPFGEAGWGADDDEMAYQWSEKGVIVHVVTDIHPYRNSSGSFRRLYQETGIWPNQYGSTYEKRVVWLQQNWPQHEPGLQWGEPWLTVVIQASDITTTSRVIKVAHDRLRERRFEKPFQEYPNPYSIIAWGDDQEWLAWAENRRLRQHHGNIYVSNGQVTRKNKDDKDWTGDFRVWIGKDWRDAIRPNSFFYGLVRTEEELQVLLDKYNKLHPPQLVKKSPPRRGNIG